MFGLLFDRSIKCIKTTIVALSCVGVNPYSPVLDFSHQNLTSKVDPRTVRVKIFLIAVDSQQRYSNESERVD